MTPDHGRVITTSLLADGSELVDTRSYYKGQEAAVKQEREVSIVTDKQRLLKDIIDALSVITSNETKKLVITLNVDKHDHYRLIKRWTVKFVDNGRK